MTDKTPRHDLREIQHTDEKRAAEKKVGDTPFQNPETGPQEPPAEVTSPPAKQQ